MNLLYEAHMLVMLYHGYTALSLSDFSMDRGEAVALTGYNGCGKSTLLRLLAFLEKPSSGTLCYHSSRATDPRREVTLLLQAPYLVRESVFHNVTLGLRLRGQKKGLDAAYQDAMHAVGFDHAETMAARGPGELSGGELQRVALAARLALRPAVLLLDEPTSSVDARSARAIVAAVSRCLEQGTSIVYATHDRNLLCALGGREVCLGEQWDADVVQNGGEKDSLSPKKN